MAHYDVRHIGQYIIIEIKNNRYPYSRLGITVTRRYGKAHLRNRFKRKIREIFRQHRHSLRQSIDIHIKPRPASLKATFDNIKEEFLRYTYSE